MHVRSSMFALGAALLLASASAMGLDRQLTGSADPLAALDQQPNDLARLGYLARRSTVHDPATRQTALQLLATTESELGLYYDAVHNFPFDNRVAVSPHLVLPQRPQWAAEEASDVIAKLASQRRIVLINEAHHDVSTRRLTLALLPRLRALGYRYFAAEALSDKDISLAKRGYPVASSGSEYLHEPLYGEIVRQALRLGYIVVPYDSDAESLAVREDEQAKHLYERVLAQDPKARLFVHGGYAHVDKAAGNLGDAVPMGMRLGQLCGCDPLSIDQTQFRDVGKPLIGAYRQLVEDFRVERPVVLVQQSSGAPWSADPTKHDISVILPPLDERQRPAWLSLGGQRDTFELNDDFCLKVLPCVVEARYPGESDQAIAADRQMLLPRHTHGTLYLYPGSYRLRSWGLDGKPLDEETIKVPVPR